MTQSLLLTDNQGSWGVGMYQSLEPVRLRSGETVEAGLIRPPDLEWADRIEALLSHQDDIWNWQNRINLRHVPDLDITYYLLHRDGNPFASMASWEVGGVAMRGHVWTVPSERRNGACKGLIEQQMDDFRARGGKTLYLFTNYQTVPYRIYETLGFEAIEPGSGHMVYRNMPAALFEDSFFPGGETEVEPLSWQRWPLSGSLFAGEYPGAVRCASWKLFGQLSPELPYLEALRAQESSGVARTQLLIDRESSAVAGLAAWRWADKAESECHVDLYCHPDYWRHADRLVDGLNLPQAIRYVAYADKACAGQQNALLRNGFRLAKEIKSVPVELCRAPRGYMPKNKFSAAVGRAIVAALRPIYSRRMNGLGREQFDLLVFERT